MLKLAISNIAWDKAQDGELYAFLREQGFCGLEIAPTRVFPETPYEKCARAKAFAAALKKDFGLSVCSMQSIWFGIGQKIFGTEEERNFLVSYTKKAVDFARAAGIGNLVFGCPKNRDAGGRDVTSAAISFFSEIGAYAAANETIIALEPNPPIYGTDFLNTTASAFAFCRAVSCGGLMVNVDLGTVIENGEDLGVISENLALVNHVHISEPYLAPIKKRSLHAALRRVLEDGGYDKFVSVEMKNMHDAALVRRACSYVKEVFA